MTDSINIIGLMSGTSVDGLDVCYVSFPKNKIEEYEILNCTTLDYPTDLKNQLNTNYIKLASLPDMFNINSVNTADNKINN